VITSFTGEYSFLSNFWIGQINVFGGIYPSAEHAYQASKALTQDDHDLIARTSTPGQAKKAGKLIKLSPDWELVKIHVMRAIVQAKFEQHPDLTDKLMKTRPLELIEGNTWGDKFWGQCPIGSGRNELGKILMAIRDDITGI
jgi:ribA/ribD-fused uncharacterized protein